MGGNNSSTVKNILNVSAEETHKLKVIANPDN